MPGKIFDMERSVAIISDQRELVRLIDSSESESFEALENKPKCKFSVEDDSSVMMGEGEEDDDG